MKRIPKEILVLIAIFLAGVISVLWYVYDAKAKQRRQPDQPIRIAPSDRILQPSPTTSLNPLTFHTSIPKKPKSLRG
jgi:hypothetical protein